MNARAGLVFSSCAICLLAPACTPPAREDGGGGGPRVMFMEVAPNIKLEVLEWSTGGEPLILLAGAGHTAHVFEHFAPYLTDEFRVLGITRRRHGASTVPEDDFGIDEFGQDIVAVMDQFGIESANFAGHSFGGAELTYLALNFPHRVRKLVYIDGSWDCSRVYYADGWRDPGPSFPMQPADSA